ncbi:MAG: hypothetical protein LBC03_00690 [Nitrososphaerota archaeon]|nr:hypothetical protein [Nitrososphaerota archaeon]
MKFQFWRDERVCKKFQDIIGRLKSKRALLGVDAGILIAFFTITLYALYYRPAIIL